MPETIVKQKRPRGDKTVGNLSRIERDLKAYELHLAGCTVRGVCEELKLKSTRTGWAAIKRGKAWVIERGIPTNERKVEIDALFKSTLAALSSEIQRQAEEGRIIEISRNDGSSEVRRTRGIDARIAGELSRSLNRWAEFCGLLERAPEISTAQTLISLAAPANGADFSSKWDRPTAEVAVVDVPATSSSGIPTTAELTPSLPASSEV